MLTIPDVRQGEDYDCGAACIDAVRKFYSVRAKAEKLANPVQGMDPATVEAILRASGFDVLSGTMTIRDLKHLTDNGRPVICPIDMYGGHWVVVAGVARLKVTFMDSALPRDKPNPCVLSANAWAARWQDKNWLGHSYNRWGICVSKR